MNERRSSAETPSLGATQSFAAALAEARAAAHARHRAAQNGVRPSAPSSGASGSSSSSSSSRSPAPRARVTTLFGASTDAVPGGSVSSDAALGGPSTAATISGWRLGGGGVPSTPVTLRWRHKAESTALATVLGGAQAAAAAPTNTATGLNGELVSATYEFLRQHGLCDAFTRFIGTRRQTQLAEAWRRTTVPAAPPARGADATRADQPHAPLPRWVPPAPPTTATTTATAMTTTTTTTTTPPPPMAPPTTTTTTTTTATTAAPPRWTAAPRSTAPPHPPAGVPGRADAHGTRLPHPTAPHQSTPRTAVAAPKRVLEAGGGGQRGVAGAGPPSDAEFSRILDALRAPIRGVFSRDEAPWDTVDVCGHALHRFQCGGPGGGGGRSEVIGLVRSELVALLGEPRIEEMRAAGASASAIAGQGAGEGSGIPIDGRIFASLQRAGVGTARELRTRHDVSSARAAAPPLTELSMALALLRLRKFRVVTLAAATLHHGTAAPDSTTTTTTTSTDGGTEPGGRPHKRARR